MRRRSTFLALRRLRRAALKPVSVIDGPANWLNHKRPYPPFWMRQEVGPLKVFEASAASMVTRLRYTAGLRDDGRLLDVGCGCGALPLALDLYGNYDGQYHGLDVDGAMIDWCNKHLASDRMRFTHHDYWSGTYNPHGKPQIPFPIEDGWASVILMKSVVTHMLPEHISWYLRETKRTLAPEGTAVITALLYDGAELQGFPHDGGGYRYARAESPETSIALSRAWMDHQMREAGLTYSYEPGAKQGPMTIRHS